MFPETVEVAAIWKAVEAAAEQAGLGVYAVRIDCAPPTVLYASRRVAEIVGRSQDELIGAPPWVILAGPDRARVQEILTPPLSLDPDATKSLDIVVERPDGTQLSAILGITRFAARDGLYSLTYLRDLSVEREAVAALRQSEQRFRKLVEAAPDGVVILQRGNVVFINERGAQLLANASVGDVLGRPLAGYLPAEDMQIAGERIGRLLATGIETPPTEYSTLCDPERVVEIKAIVIEWDGAPAVLAFARDVTDRKRLQARLVETDRLAALGTLSAGVAHEINNPLTYATLGLQRIERALTNLDVSDTALAPIRAQLREVEHGLSRVATITRGLRSFARPDDAPPGAVDLVEVVDRSLRMVDNDLRHRATLARSIAPVPPVTGNASRLEQVVVNLLLNAIQSLPPNRDNTIEVIVAPTDDNRVSLAIRDTGLGIPPAIADRIFEPFFTTRSVGDGMGLGLSVCRTIMEAVGGTIGIARSDEHGTTMALTLRVHPGVPAATSAASPTAPSPRARSSTSRKRVLIIDDEPLLRDTLTRVLSGDHDITTAHSGADALAKLESTHYDAILCDVMMPGMSGVEVYHRVATAHPGLERRMVFITGGTFTPELDDLVAATRTRLLTKPFQLGDVIDAVDRVASSD